MPEKDDDNPPLKRLKRSDDDDGDENNNVSLSLREFVKHHVLEGEADLRRQYVQAKPYSHCVLRDVFQDDFIAKVKQEIKHHSKVNFKESDLFRVYQSIDMANLKDDGEHAATFPSVLQLRRVLYSQPWRSLMERLCGLETGTLTEKVDCACNCHTEGCHLLCHDDVIGTRKISYILYLTESDWTAKEGGALELYDREEERDTKSNANGAKMNASDSATAVPKTIPSGTLLPIFNNMAFFKVEPGLSFHSVQEVLGDRPRLSLQGWYHAAEPPKNMQAATLQQLKTEVDQNQQQQQQQQEATPYTPFEYPTTKNTASSAGQPTQLSDADRKYLSEYLHETYLTDEALENIGKRFEEESSVQLQTFLCDRWAERLNKARVAEEAAFRRSVGDAGYYEQGVSSEWRLVGPAHKQRYLEYQSDASQKKKDDEPDTSTTVGSILHHLKEKVLCSIPFQRFLARITSLGLPLGQRGHIRCFRKGLDYTVAHYGILTKQSVLDATLCFVAGGQSGNNQNTHGDAGTNQVGGKEAKEGDKMDVDVASSKKNDEPCGEDDIWQSGDGGGFECYIAADDDDEAGEEAADQYNQEDDTELLSVSASNNTLSLVYRDPGTMRFVKYVGMTAPSSRWDVAMEYEVENDDDEEAEGEEDNEKQKEK